MTPDDLRQGGELFNQELGLEWYRVGAGLTGEPAFQAIYERHADLASPEALATAQSSKNAPLFEWVVGNAIGRATAALDEQQERLEQSTSITLDDDTTIPFQRIPIELGNTPDRDRRRAINDARRGKLADLAAICRERFRRERGLLTEVMPGDAVDARRHLSGIDLDDLAGQARAFLDATDDLYRASLNDIVIRRFGSVPDDLARFDIAYLFRAESFDDAFPGDRLLDTAVQQFGEMQFDATCEGRVRFDTEEREGKHSRAFVSPARVPDEVYLVLRPHGGHSDYRTFYHELGHAMHFASVDSNRSFEDRWLGDNSVTEGYAMLNDHLTLDLGWLRRYTDIAKGKARDLLREVLTEELYLIRRYAAKLNYECTLYRADPDADLGNEYTERLTSATGFRYEPDDALIDVDPGFYAARYLRAWQLQAALARHLPETYDEDWYRTPRVAPVLHELYARGQATPADRLAEEITGRPLTFDAVHQRLEAELS